MHNECFTNTKKDMYILEYKDIVCELILWILQVLQSFFNMICGVCASKPLILIASGI